MSRLRGGASAPSLRFAARVGLVLAVAICWTAPAAAQVGLVHAARLPSDANVQQAYQAALALEPMARDFSAPWTFSEPKTTVAERLKEALAAIEAASARQPDDEELALLTGAVASEAYNLDVPAAYDAAVTALKRAARIATRDPRPLAVLGHFHCETSDQLRQGMTELLNMETHFPAAELSDFFWSSYLICAVETGMPSHARRAAARLSAIRPLTAAEKVAASDVANLATPPDPQHSYSPDEVWQSEPLAAGDVAFSSAACGLELRVPTSWDMAVYPLANSTCMVEATPQSLPGKTGPVQIHFLVIARPADKGQSVDAFARQFAARFHGQAAAVLVCPVATCLSFAIPASQTAITSEGGETGHLTVFRTLAQTFPGLIFETSHQFQPGKQGGPQFYRLKPQLGRLAAEMDYTVLLDAAASVLPAALQLYRNFMQGLIVDDGSR